MIGEVSCLRKETLEALERQRPNTLQLNTEFRLEL